MAQKTMGAILNEAADANERGMESSRRSALTNLQIKGQVADQNYQEEQRGRDREFYGGMKAAAQKHLFKDEMIPGSGGAITGAPGELIQPSQMRRIPIDLSTSDGLKAISAFQQEVFQLRASQGRITGEEMGQLLDFRKRLDQAGATQDFKAALGGDEQAAARLGKIIGVSDTVKVLSGFDDASMPQIYALTRSVKDGKVVEQKVPVGHLIGAASSDLEAMLKSQRDDVKARDEMRSSASTRLYQDRSGRAALENAGTARRNAETSSNRYTRQAVQNDEYMAFTREIPDNPSNWLATGFDRLGEQAIDDKGSSVMRTIGSFLIKEQGMNSGRALMQASTDFAALNTAARGKYDRELAAARAASQAPEASDEDRQNYRDLQRNGVRRWQDIRDDLLRKTHEMELREIQKAQSQAR